MVWQQARHEALPHAEGRGGRKKGMKGSQYLIICFMYCMYRAEKKSWYVVARNFYLLLLNCSAWPCLGPA